MTLTVGSLCTGVYGLELGLSRVIDVDVAWHAEVDPHASTVLAARCPAVPNLGDLRTVDWAQVEPVDLICFGFPCQDISSAGRRAGLEGEKSGLWFDCAMAVRVVRPRYVFVENVSALLTRGLDRVLADLAEMGYVGRWGCLRSSDVGAPHRRERIFIAAVAADPDDVGPARPWRSRSGEPRPSDGRDSTADTDGSARSPRDAEPGDGSAPDVPGGTPGPGGRGRPAAYPDGQRLPGQQEPDGEPIAGLDASRRSDAGRRHDAVGWGPYAAAIARWAAIQGPAPAPRDGRGRLNPALPEWMLGLPPGWVTGLDIPRTAQLRLLGNACQPQVVELAARLLLVPLMSEAVAA